MFSTKSSYMSPEPKPAEKIMLEVVAYYDPIDYHKLRQIVGERFDTDYGTKRHRAALKRLEELRMVEQPGKIHEYIHITEQGWSHLGGETPRHADAVEIKDAVDCPFCVTDQKIESNW
jgi:hypothetical protein